MWKTPLGPAGDPIPQSSGNAATSSMEGRQAPAADGRSSGPDADPVPEEARPGRRPRPCRRRPRDSVVPSDERPIASVTRPLSRPRARSSSPPSVGRRRSLPLHPERRAARGDPRALAGRIEPAGARRIHFRWMLPGGAFPSRAARSAAPRRGPARVRDPPFRGRDLHPCSPNRRPRSRRSARAALNRPARHEADFVLRGRSASGPVAPRVGRASIGETRNGAKVPS
jgi:hypothetical protein